MNHNVCKYTKKKRVIKNAYAKYSTGLILSLAQLILNVVEICGLDYAASLKPLGYLRLNIFPQFLNLYHVCNFRSKGMHQ